MSDLISRQAAIDTLNDGAELLKRVLDDADIVGLERAKYEWGLGLIESYISDMKELPSADIDLSDYSDRLWRNAYEQGKAVSKDALDEAYAHGYTAAEADFHKQNQWIPVTERLPEEDYCTGANIQYSASVLMTVYNAEDEETIIDYGHTADGKWYSETTDCLMPSWWEVLAWMPLPECYRGDGNGE